MNLLLQIDEWNATGESLVWIDVHELNENSKIFAYWGNDSNITMPNYDVWSDYQGVWHLQDALDSSNAGRNASSEGSVTQNQPGVIGKSLTLSSSGNLVVPGYKESYRIRQGLSVSG